MVQEAFNGLLRRLLGGRDRGFDLLGDPTLHLFSLADVSRPEERSASVMPVTGSCCFHFAISSFGRYRSGSYIECARKR